MKIFVIKTQLGFRPVHGSDQEVLNKFKNDEIFEADIKKSRNINFHRKFFSLLNLGFDNSKSGIDNFDSYRAYATMKAGHYTVVTTPDGKFTIPKSISFSSMDELEFEKVYQSVLNFVIKDTGATEQDVEQNLINYF